MHDQGPNQFSPPDARRLTPDAATRKPEAGSRKPWIPDSKLRPLPANSINSFIRNILLTNPLFPRFYADVVIDSAPNSQEAKLLRANYKKILAKVNVMSNSHSCTHIKATGVRCGSPSLRGEQFCYFHQNAHRGVRRPPQSRLHPIALIEDEESIQYALMEVINALMRNTIDYKRATLIIRALHIATKNASRVRFSVRSRDAVKEIPDYPEPTTENEEIAMQSELPAVSAMPYKPVDPHNPHFWEHTEEGARILAREQAARKAATAATTTETVRVGTDAFVRPAQAKPSVPEGARPNVTASRTTSAAPPAAVQVPPHNFRKPPTATKQPPQVRKNGAHRASAG